MEPQPSNHNSSSHTAAPLYSLPRRQFQGVEYPGYVSTTSVPRAISNLGGLGALDRAFHRPAKEEAFVELKLRPDDPFSHPIPGVVAPASTLVLKIVKRRRKLKDVPMEGDPKATTEPIGEFTAEPMGTLPKTIRFRSMADFQFRPDESDPISQLRHAMQKMDVDAIQQFRMPLENADYVLPIQKTVPEPLDMNLDPQLVQDSDSQPNPSSSEERSLETIGLTAEQQNYMSNLRLFPPPIFSRQTISQNYNYKANPTSIVSTTVDESTGEEKTRLINRMRWKGYGPATITFADSAVPTQAPSTVEELRPQVDKKIYAKLQSIFEERPIWTRQALLNQCTAAESREIINSKIMLPLVSYVFHDGPWRDTLVKFGYDPRVNLDARFYQRIYFRNANHPINRPSVITRKQDRAALAADQGKEPIPKHSHIFDGQTLTKETAAFQLCDITDPMLKEMIGDQEGLRESCNERDGWYSAHAMERIKIVLRTKFFTLLDGYPATDEACLKLLQEAEEAGASAKTALASTTRHRHKIGKHNMAKGALRPEDAAVARLESVLKSARGGSISGSH